ncbi:MAG TPA: 50S ribosomal protein L33 [Spirochaetota bacterium]|nr:50S ribosomal protein L33 [Spirochaetota bacterium]
MQEVITLECQECKRRNYSTYTNKKNNDKKLSIKKYCKWDNKRTVHKQVK